MRADADGVPVGMRITVWALGTALAAIGVVLAVVTSSWWPLIAFLGLGLPLIPFGRAR